MQGPHNGARNSSFALATLRTDGFAALRGSGDVTTVALNVTGPTLTLTADVLAAGGSVAAQIVNGAGAAAPPVTANVTAHPVIHGLTVGSRVVVKLTLKDASVYAVGFAPG